MKKIFLLLLCVISLQAAQADLVIFSFDRPLQLYALLESIATYMTGVGEMHVIYRASDDSYACAYDEVFEVFPEVERVEQGANPRADFKPLTVSSTFDTPNEHILFAVDDIIVKDYVDLAECIKMLEHTGAYGFYLRLGKHITYNYANNKKDRAPSSQEVAPGIHLAKFASSGYFGYPNTVDMTLYRKSDIEQEFRLMGYGNPNNLEGNWAGRAGSIKRSKKQLFFTNSKMVNLPLNRVQNTYQNRNMNLLTPQEMLDVFNEGLKIDIEPLHQINNASAHMEYEPTFMQR